MIFDSQGPTAGDSKDKKQADDQDSTFSGYSGSRLQRKANLELVWQKANSINGIRKMNMQFKEERRTVKALTDDDLLTPEYW